MQQQPSSGPPVQALPGDLPQPARGSGPIAPPMMAPTPSWKQEKGDGDGGEKKS